MSSEPATHAEPLSYRLHWSSLFFGLGPVARGALPLLLLLLLSRETATWQLWALAGLIPGALVSVARFLTLTYRTEPDELVIAEGLVSRRVRHVPYTRIQHVEVTQGPLQRLLGVANVRVQSGGGAEEPEAALTVLTVARADALRAHVAQARGDVTRDRLDAPMLALGARDLVLSGLTQGRGWLVVGAVLGTAWQVADFAGVEAPYRGRVSDETLRRGLGMLPASTPPLLIAVLGIVAAVILFRVLSIGWAAVKLHGFTLTRDGEVLRSRYGLVTRFSAAIPRHRVQLLTIVETPAMRLARRVAVKVETAARFAAEENRVGAQWLAPVIERHRAPALAAEVLAGVSIDAFVWRGVHPSARRRLRWRFLALATLAVLAVVAVVGRWGAAITPLAAAFAWIAAARVAARYAYAVSPEAVAVRAGWWTRHTSVVRIARIQVLELTESFLDRRWGMATVAVDTAGATDRAHRVIVPFLPRAEAARLFEVLREAAARTELAW